MSKLEHDPFKLLYLKYNISKPKFDFIEHTENVDTHKETYLQGEKLPIRTRYSKRSVGNCKAYINVPFEYIDTPTTCFLENDNTSCNIINT
jgi:hypothetical protein